MADPLARFPEFTQAVQRRLDAGRGSYGDRTFTRDPVAIIDEALDEAKDLAGYAYILWHRLERLKTALDRAEPLSPTTKVTNAP
jgi:hypothetical protein